MMVRFCVLTKAIRTLSTASKTGIKIVEVGPRDGLQNEKTFVPTDVKVELINRLSAAGLTYIEVSSFVSLKWVPQLADAADLFKTILRKPSITYAALIPNANGLNEAVKWQVDEVATFAAASETFSKRNINCAIEESFQRFKQVLDLAKSRHLPVRGYISCAAGCPYEGDVPADRVARMTERLYSMGCREISLGDTIGVATPDSMDHLLQVVLSSACPVSAIAVHCHDTGGMALRNIDVALDSHGVTILDAAIGGLGGCPYAGPGVPGNVATESVVAHLLRQSDRYSLPPELQVNRLAEIGAWIRTKIASLRSSPPAGN